MRKLSLSIAALMASAGITEVNAMDWDKTSRNGSLSSQSHQSAPRYNQRKARRDARRVNRAVKR